jgi:hypothetical protein
VLAAVKEEKIDTYSITYRRNNDKSVLVALVHCENCTQLIDADVLPYCDEECRKAAHNRYLGRPAQETRTTRPAPPARRTVSIRESFAGDQSLSPSESSRRNGERTPTCCSDSCWGHAAPTGHLSEFKDSK